MGQYLTALNFHVKMTAIIRMYAAIWSAKTSVIVGSTTSPRQ